MSNTPASVTAAPSAGVPEGTPGAGGVAQTTPAPAAADAQPGTDWQAQAKKLETDLNRLKSSLQSQMAQERARYQQTLAQYQQQLDEARTQGMTEEDRRKYDEQRRVRAAQQLAEQNAQLQRQLEEQQVRLQYIQQYEEAGIPRSQLVLNGSLEDLVQSGWQAVTQLARAARGIAPTTAPAAGQPAPAAAPVQPPAVVTNTGAVPQPPTLEALMARYKADDPEEIFRMFETGQIPADQMPIN